MPVGTFDDTQRAYLFKEGAAAGEREEEINRLNLSPLTAEVLAIGMLNPDTGGGRVLYRSDRNETFHSDDGKIEFISGDEGKILSAFWDDIRNYGQFITFNGRTFDCPFLMLRSALLGLRPTKEPRPLPLQHRPPTATFSTS